ncbi:MAG: YraN family protein [Phycisphaerae bacterium]|nr:YraN family protein [Phycisphaerae bacterium]
MKLLGVFGSLALSAVARAWSWLAPRRVRAADRGERAAARDLERLGWELLAANLRVGSDEADLVCRDPRGNPVLVEVKSSRGGAMAPELQVGPRKQAALRRLALSLSRDRRLAFGGAVPRIDVIVVLLDARVETRDRVLRHLVAAVGDGPRRVPTRGELRRTRR